MSGVRKYMKQLGKDDAAMRMVKLIELRLS